MASVGKPPSVEWIVIMPTRKVAIITGASRGIGAGLVAGYRGRGWAVVASSRTIKPSRDRDLLAVEGDVSEPATADRIVDAALERFGRIDTLVNNAGVYHLQAVHRLHRRRLRRRGGSRPDRVLLADPARHRRDGGAVRRPRRQRHATLAELADSGTPAVLTALTKGGLAAATRSLAIEYASRGIRVNAVSPGVIQTPMHPAGTLRRARRRLPPLGRVGQVSDVVDGVLFLESSPFITGEILHIDGGQIAGTAPP